MDKLRLEEFRAIYRYTYGWPLPIRYVIFGWLYWLETKYIEAKAIAAVDKAIREYEEQEPIDSTNVPIIIEKPSQVEGLPEMRITAPFYKDETLSQVRTGETLD